MDKGGAKAERGYPGQTRGNFLWTDKRMNRCMQGRTFETSFIRSTLSKSRPKNNKWSKATSPSCHPSRWQMESSDFDPYLIHGSLGQCEPAPYGTLISSPQYTAAKSPSASDSAPKRHLKQFRHFRRAH